MAEFLKDLWTRISGSERYLPSYIKIPAAQTDRSEDLAGSFDADKNYFTVRVNEMFLQKEREWFTKYDPVVIAVTEFVYDEAKVTVPFVVGPHLLQNGLTQELTIKEGMIFKNTTVAGTHPFRGDPFSIRIVLARLEKKDYLRDLLKLIESAAGTYTHDFATVVNNYLKVSKVVLDGIDTLLGKKELDGLIGHSNTIMLNAGDDFKPGYYALINQNEKETDSRKFFIVDNALCYGNSLQDCTPYREADYVLYSIMSTVKRKDLNQLPFYKKWKDLLAYSMPLNTISAEQWDLIKGKLFALHGELRLSPDLVRSQVTELMKEYTTEVNEIKSQRESLSAPEAEKIMISKWDKEQDEMALQILKM